MMNNFNPTGISTDVKEILNDYHQKQQNIVTSALIQEGGTAEVIAEALCNEIIKFQSSLPVNTDVAISVVQFSQNTTLLVDSIGYIGYNLIWFSGTDSNGKPLKLIQHVQQLNFLLMVVPTPAPSTPKRKIGFVHQNVV